MDILELYEGWLISLWPKVEGDELYSSYYMHLSAAQSNYAESVKWATFEVFVFQITEKLQVV